MASRHPSISIVCVYNSPAVRRDCLDRSIEALAAQAEAEYIPVDNVNGTYPTAGAALNAGVARAANDVVVFAHQDVYLHSLAALQVAASALRDEGFGLLGAVGVRSDGLLMGRIRDRVMLTGTQVDGPADVDSVDEVLFMAPRSQLLADPLSESPELGWHAYAVDYGLQVRQRGLRTGVADIPLTHNSLSVNLARLDEAHQDLARRYADFLPVQTTCGAITSRTAGPGRTALLAPHRWRYRWLRDSMALQTARRLAGPVNVVLADLRYTLDDVVERAPGRRLLVLNCNSGRPFGPAGRAESLALRRRDGVITFSDHPVAEITRLLAAAAPASWTLVTNLSEADLRLLRPYLPPARSMLGFHAATGLWLLLGPALADRPASWRSRGAAPLSLTAVAGAPPSRQPIPAALATDAPKQARRAPPARQAGSAPSKAPTRRRPVEPALGPDADRTRAGPKGRAKTRRRQTKPNTEPPNQPVTNSHGDVSGGDTPLRIPYGNKEAAQALGARYRAGGWYVPADVSLTAFRQRGWL